ncbi:MAG: HD-GYP domain-containing protein [Spirochaetes bacterium]|nr:HD-GYP domain-containing protein [Spirochaetota bacterium]
MNIISFTVLTFYTSLLFFIFFLFSTLVNLDKDKKGFSYAFFFFSLSLIVFGQYKLEALPESMEMITFWAKIRGAGAISLILSFPLAVRTFFNSRFPKGYFYFLIISFTALMGILFPTDLVISDKIIKMGYLPTGGPGDLYIIFQSLLAGVIIYEIVNLINLYHSMIREKKYIGALLFGMIIAALTGFYDLFGPFFNFSLPTIPSMITYGLFALIMTIGTVFIWRYFDILYNLQNSEKQIRKLLEKSRMETLELLELITSAVEARDKYTAGHSRRVMEYALKIADVLNLQEEEKRLLKTACMLHDIGKIGIPESILNKPGKLTTEEYSEIKKHPVIGVEILSHFHYFVKLLPYIYHHHERVDGMGYPKGIKKERIPLLSRIIAVADTFDALTSDRPYRKAMPVTKAIQVLEDVKGTQLDSQIVNILLNIIHH